MAWVLTFIDTSKVGIHKYRCQEIVDAMAAKKKVVAIATIKTMADGMPRNIPLYTIGTAARILGISVHTIRMYERNGLIVPHKTDSRQKRYAESDIERLHCIR